MYRSIAFVLLMSLASGCGEPARDEDDCAATAERLAALELEQAGRGLPAADRRALVEALALHRGDAWQARCDTAAAAPVSFAPSRLPLPALAEVAP